MMAEQDTVKEKDDNILMKNWKGDPLLPDKFNDHQPAFLKMLEEFNRKWDGHLGRIIVAKPHKDIFNDDVRPVRSASNRAGPTARKVAAPEIFLKIIEKVIKLSSTK